MLYFRIKFILIILFSVLYWNCASVKAPPGGPVDDIPPEILNINPPSGTVNLTENKVTVEFSEYMDANSFNSNITVFPRLENPIKYKFKGNKIQLFLPKDIDSSKTYIIQLNRNIKDEHGVPLSIAEQLAYSRGSKISRGQIIGVVYGDPKKSVHLWKMDNQTPDSIFAQLPDYVTDADDKGYYSFDYLAPGQYKILAVNSNSRGTALIPERTEYGLTWKDILEIGEADTLNNINMRIFKEPQDLKMVRGEWNKNNWGKLYFNNDLPDTFNLKLQIIQNDKSVEHNFYKDLSDKKSLLITLNDSLVGALNIKIISLFNKDSTFLDSASIEVQIPSSTDTTYLELMEPKSNLSIIPDDFNGDDIKLLFSKPAKLTADTNLLPYLMNQDSSLVDININEINPLQFILNPKDGWDENERYKLNILHNGIIPDRGRGLQDSVTVININTTNRMGFGGVVGSVRNKANNNIMVELFSTKKPSLSREAFVNFKSEFEYKNIPEGDYSLRFYIDKNNDMKYNFGRAYQNEPSEWFYYYPDTFEVRANWDTELIPIILPEVQ